MESVQIGKVVGEPKHNLFSCRCDDPHVRPIGCKASRGTHICGCLYVGRNEVCLSSHGHVCSCQLNPGRCLSQGQHVCICRGLFRKHALCYAMFHRSGLSKLFDRI